MKGLECDNAKCIYSHKLSAKQSECTAAKVIFQGGKCVTKCYRTEINDLMVKFKGGRNDQRVTGMLK